MAISRTRALQRKIRSLRSLGHSATEAFEMCGVTGRTFRRWRAKAEAGDEALAEWIEGTEVQDESLLGDDGPSGPASPTADPLPAAAAESPLARLKHRRAQLELALDRAAERGASGVASISRQVAALDAQISELEAKASPTAGKSAVAPMVVVED